MSTAIAPIGALRIRIVQASCLPQDLRFNLAAALDILHCSAGRTDLVLFPEMFLGEAAVDTHAPDSAPAFTEEMCFAQLQRAARAAGVAVAMGACERREGRLYSSATLIDAAGTVLLRRLRPAGWVDDDRRGSIATGRLLVQAWKRVGVALCFSTELDDGQLAGDLASKGASLLLHLDRSSARNLVMRSVHLPHVAASNGVVLASANLVGESGDASFGGRSMALDRHGRVLAYASSRHEELIDTTLEVPTLADRLSVCAA